MHLADCILVVLGPVFERRVAGDGARLCTGNSSLKVMNTNGALGGKPASLTGRGKHGHNNATNKK